MNNENILYIEDAKKRRLSYRFTPAALISNFVPLVVILDSQSQTQNINFEYKMWNILTPIDAVGIEEQDLVQLLISQIAEEYECEDHIYFYGSLAEASKVITHGILSNANAVYIDSPLIKFEENTLNSLLDSTNSFPIFFLCEHEAKLQEGTKDFIATCEKYTVTYSLNFCLKKENDKIHTIKKVLDMLEKESSQV